MDNFFGGRPAIVILRLVAISIVVGIVMAALNLDALALLHNFKQLVLRIKEMGFDAIEWGFNYFLLGAVIVFPIWLISRLLRGRGRGDRSQS